MTDAPQAKTGSTVTTSTVTTTLRRVLVSVPALWVGFVLVHAWIVQQAVLHPNELNGDVELYRFWMAGGMDSGSWPVLDTDWVYPVGALAPMWLPAQWSLDSEAYRVLFSSLIILLDGLAVGSLLHAGRGRTLGAWWWLAFLLALGPINLMRLDGVSAALTVIAIAQLAPTLARPEGRVGLATALATGAAWIKVAPGAVVLPLAIVARRPWRRVVLPAAVVSAVVVGLALVGGAGTRVLAFFGDQGDRGLQVEAGAATPFSVARLWSGDYSVFYNEPLKVLEIAGPGTSAWASALNAVLLASVAAVAVATWFATRRVRRAVPDDVARRGPDLELVLLATTALSLCLFAFNKVGSPQYVAWFAPPVAVAIAVLGPRTSHLLGRWTWGTIALVLLPVAGLTQYLYPNHYNEFLTAQPLDVWLVAVRNVLILLLAVGTGALVAFRARAVAAGPAAG